METLDDGAWLDDNKDTGKSLVPEHSQPVHPKTQQKEAKAAVQYIDKVIWKETTGYSLEAALNIGSRRTQARNLFADLDCDEDSGNNVPARKTAARKTAPAERPSEIKKLREQVQKWKSAFVKERTGRRADQLEIEAHYEKILELYMERNGVSCSKYNDLRKAMHLQLDSQKAHNRPRKERRTPIPKTFLAVVTKEVFERAKAKKGMTVVRKGQWQLLIDHMELAEEKGGMGLKIPGAPATKAGFLCKMIEGLTTA